MRTLASVVGTLERRGLASASAQLNPRGNGRNDLLVLPGLGHEISGAPLHGLYGCVDAAVSGNHDHDDVGVDCEDTFEPLEPLLSRRFARPEVHVQQHGVEGVPLHEIRDTLGPKAGHHLGETAPQQQSSRRQDVVVVIDDENGADLAHRYAPETVRNRTLAVRKRTV